MTHSFRLGAAFVLALIAAACSRPGEDKAGGSGPSPTDAPRVGAEAGGVRQFPLNFPSAEDTQRAREELDYQRAITAYRFWYPTVSMAGIFNGSREVGLRENETALLMAVSPAQVFFTPNSDTPYGGATVDLSSGPFVVELPPGPFIGLINDHHQRWIADMGLPGPDAGNGGKHLILPPDYDLAPPPGYHLARATSNKVLVAVRSIPQGGDVQAALAAIQNIKIRPLSSPNRTMKFVDKSNVAMDATLLRWEDNIQFWQVLAKVIEAEPMVGKFRPMYGMLATLGIEKGKPFNPDARLKGILERAAKAGRDQMLVESYDSARPDRITWKDRRWEWASLISTNANFETPNGMDLVARERWFAQAIVASPAMFRRTPGAGSLYWLGARDRAGNVLDGGKLYKLTVPLPVPNKLFWSVTVYDAATRSQIATDQNRAALRSLVELKDASGKSIDLYFGPSAPAGHEAHWIKTMPDKGWFSYFRIYGPEQAAFDGTWRPGDFDELR